MTTLGASAMPTSKLNPFLFARIGTQTNGVELSVLSLLARLGSDPWVEAGRLAELPRSAATDWLAERIATMPLSSPAIDAARETALRLLLLLPARATIEKVVSSTKTGAARMPVWAMAAMVLVAIALSVAATALQSSPPPGPEQGVRQER